MSVEQDHRFHAHARFGTFAGVFTPTVLTILGLILFLRIGWVVGQAGLAGALVIIGIANLISLITGLSLSCVATNMHVKTGGVYYMISRTLGLEIGGAIGLPLFLSQAISVAFYVIGFTEAFVAILPVIDPRILSTALILLFGLLACIGADFILKIQFLILALLAVALASFFAGGWETWVTPTAMPTSDSSVGFWAVFAIFFPAVTGIAAGVSMSGDLRDPASSIPKGTLAAIGLTAAIYITVALWLATHATVPELIGNTMIMKSIARWPFLIVLGVWASTLSSALGSVLAAPRTLQAVAFDGVVPKLFAGQLGSPTEPRVAVISTTIIAAAIVWLGDLDFVATLITMFFLNTYGMINLTAGIEMMLGNPSFRPRLRVPWPVCLVGAVGCYGAMFLINAPATAVAVFISYGVFALLSRRALRQDWGDIRAGLWFGIARFGLIRLEFESRNVKNWRPNIVAFTGLRDCTEPLMELGAWLATGRGIMTFYHLVVGNIEELAGCGLREEARGRLQKYVHERGLLAFTESSIVRNLHHGILQTVQAHGVAGLEPNTILLGWGTDPEIRKDQLKMARTLVSLGKSAAFLSFVPHRAFGNKKQIDIWWGGKGRNAELMLLLAHIISQSQPWMGSRIRVIQWVEEPETSLAEEQLNTLLRAVRVNAQPVVVTKKERDEPLVSALKQLGQSSDLTFLGLSVPKESDIERQAQFLDTLLATTGSTLLVRSGEKEDLLVSESQ